MLRRISNILRVRDYYDVHVNDDDGAEVEGERHMMMYVNESDENVEIKWEIKV